MTEETPVPWWVKLLKDFGLPTFLLVAVMVGLTQSGVWVAKEIVKPWVEQSSAIAKKQAEEQSEYLKKATALVEAQSLSDAESRVRIKGQADHSIDMLRVTNEIETITKSTNGMVRENAVSIEHGNKAVLDVLRKIEENTKPLREGMP